MRDDRARLSDILGAIERIEKYTARGRDVFEQDDLVQTWALYHLMIIGEACRSLSAEFRTAHTQDVWTQAAGLRNVIVHQYFGIDLEIVWGVMERDLPRLKSTIKDVLSSM